MYQRSTFGIFSIVSLILTTITDLEPRKSYDYTLILGLLVMFIAAAILNYPGRTLGKDMEEMIDQSKDPLASRLLNRT